MQALEVTVQRRWGGAWPVVVEWTDPDSLPVRGEGTLRLDLDLLDAMQADPRRYGSTLGEALFGDGTVRALFERAKERSDSPLHVLLVVEDPDLKTRRWERLCAPEEDTWNFLVLDQRMPFSLYIPSSVAGAFAPIGRADLRALVAIASPGGLERFRLDPFDVEATVASVQEGMGSIPSDVVAPPTLDGIAEALTGGRYPLLHVVAHGSYGRDGETVLFLATSDGQVDPIPASLFLDRLRGIGGKGGLPRLAFLSTCESAAPSAEGALGGLAQRMVRELGIPAVVAMTDRVLLETAQALTATFYRRLWEHGYVDLALTEAYAGLDPRKHSIAVPTLFSRLGGRPLFSEDLDRPLGPGDLERGLTRLRALLTDRAPVLLERFDRGSAILRATAGTETQALTETARRERDEALREIQTICVEATEIDFHALALGRDPPAYDSRQPFRGLYPFRPEDRDFFFGREELVEKLRRRLVGERFLAVLGPSGCGKSSVVLAGLVPALQMEDPGLQVQYMTPGGDPSAQLTATLEGSERSLLLIVDQFEELFTLTEADKRKPFVADLLRVAETRRAVLTMRADFWGECAHHSDLKDLMQEHQELIAPMDASELRRAMEMQAANVGLRFDADLANTILEEVQEEPGAMPLLQHALLELWKRRRGRWLRADEYNALGRVRGAIAHTADELFETLSTDDRDRVRDVFLRLTRVDVSGPEEAWRDTRQRVPTSELVPVGTDPSVTKALVKRLADARLVVTSRNEITGSEEAEVAHEALIKHWPRLQAWLSEDREFLLWRQRLGVAVEDWKASHDEAILLRGRPLSSAERWLAERPKSFSSAARAFIEASSAAHAERQARELDEERRRRIEAEYRQLQAEAAEKSAAAERSFARAERNRQLAARVEAQTDRPDRREYLAELHDRAATFDADGEELWAAAYALGRRLKDHPGKPTAMAPPSPRQPSIFTLEVLEAGGGECLLVHFGDRERPRFLLVDGGQRRTFRDRLEPRLEGLRQRWAPGGSLPLELVLVTHQDEWNLGGIFSLLRDLSDRNDAGSPRRFDIRTLWFNNFLPIGDNETQETLRDKEELVVLAKRLGIPINEPFDYYVMPHSRGPAQVRLTDELSITVLTPSARAVEEWYAAWNETKKRQGFPLQSIVEQLDAADRGSLDAPDDRLERTVGALTEGYSSPRITLLRAPPELFVLDPPGPRADAAPANLSSIVTLLDFEGHRMLLTGDARCDHVVSGLSQAGLLSPGERLHLDLLKLPHWGSDRNVTEEFFRAVTADHYVVVANPRHGLPKPRTFQLIARARDGERYTIHVAVPASGDKLRTTFMRDMATAKPSRRTLQVRTTEGVDPLFIDLLQPVNY
jgi:CHAT domain